jgi:hypothetical protein
MPQYKICQLSDGDLIQLFMIGGILFLVIEMKLGNYSFELLCKPEFLVLENELC